MDWIAAAVAAMWGRRWQRRRLGSRDDRANTFRGEFDLAVAQNNKIPPLEKKKTQRERDEFYRGLIDLMNRF
jgi:hypothetical protein